MGQFASKRKKTSQRQRRVFYYVTFPCDGGDQPSVTRRKGHRPKQQGEDVKAGGCQRRKGRSFVGRMGDGFWLGARPCGDGLGGPWKCQTDVGQFHQQLILQTTRRDRFKNWGRLFFAKHAEVEESLQVGGTLLGGASKSRRRGGSCCGCTSVLSAKLQNR